MDSDESDQLSPSAGEIDAQASDRGSGDESAPQKSRHPRVNEPVEKSAKRHWRESTISRPGLDDRGDVFFAAIEMTRMPMLLTDPNQDDNPIVFANKAFLDLTGYEESEVLGRNCRFLQGAQTDRETVAELRDAVKEGRSIAVEILNYKRDGTPFWNALFIGPVFDTDGQLTYQFASQLDVTRRRNTEIAYRQAQKMEAIGQLTAGLAHDFNNLLQVISGNLELLDGIASDDTSRRHLGNARGAAERGAKLTRQLLAFARKSRLDPRPLDLTKLVSDFVEVIESSLGSTIHLQLNLRRRLPHVMVDPDQLEMAILNIVMNARDALSSGGTVTIATRSLELADDAEARQMPAGDYVAIEITDDGVGMAPEVLERASEPFFTTKTQGRGTGLGLAMVSGFMQQSRGRLEIESKPKEGATFRLIFPVSHLQGAESLQTKPHHVPPVAQTDDSRGVEHILVVEDSAEVLELATEILESAGYHVTTADTGEAALRLFREQPDGFNLIFTDLVMPGGINGLVLAEEIAKINPDLPILMTTGYNEELAVSGPTRHARDVLGKPYRRSELLDRIRQAINNQAQRYERRKASDFGAAEI